MKDDDDDLIELYEKYMPHRVGDVVVVTNTQSVPDKEWIIKKYMIGGYELQEIDGNKTIKVETKYVEHAEIDLNNVKGHEGHEVVISYVWDWRYDSYVYCRTCKTDVKTKHKKLPKPKKIYFRTQ